MRRDARELCGELRQLRQWVAWKLAANCGGTRAGKLPVNPHDGSIAMANDARTWGMFEEARRYAAENGLVGNAGGIGFEFANGYAGIDLDDVIIAGGTLRPFAGDIVRIMRSYTEYSPGGKGLHILFRLKEPLSELGPRRRNDELGLEMYDSGRFFTVTGNVYGEGLPVSERTEEARCVYAMYLAKPHGKVAGKVPLDVSGGVNFEGPAGNELLERMFCSLHGAEIRRLYGGDISGYGGDESRADLALCSYLAFWTNNDLREMDRMFRRSGLMRPKWDEKRGMQTYGMLTMSKALSDAGGYGSINAIQSNMIADMRPDEKCALQAAGETVRPQSISSYV